LRSEIKEPLVFGPGTLVFCSLAMLDFICERSSKTKVPSPKTKEIK